jgi:hypothetical protein
MGGNMGMIGYVAISPMISIGRGGQDIRPGAIPSMS